MARYHRQFQVIQHTPIPLAVGRQVAMERQLHRRSRHFVANTVTIQVMFARCIASNANQFFGFNTNVRTRFERHVRGTTLGEFRAVAGGQRHAIRSRMRKMIWMNIFHGFV